MDFLVAKKQNKQILEKVINIHGATKTAEVLDAVKAMGYKYSTKAAMTVSISDMTVPPEKPDMIRRAQDTVDEITRQYKRGLITEEERYKQVVGTWKETDEDLTEALLSGLDKYNNIFMMADSGARGSDKQIKQLAGMRGLMADTTGKTIELPIIARLKAAGLKVMVVCGAVKHAVKAEQAGCDAVICQGGEGGGHTGLVGTLPLVAQAVEAVKIPVIAAGGLYDGRGLAASLALGAQGVWMGTRFIASQEAHAGDLYRQAVVEAADEDTIRTRCYSGKPMRVKKNPYVDDWESRPADIQPFPQQAMVSVRNGAMGGIGGQIDGLDPEKSCFAMGQSAGGVRDVLPAGEIVTRLVAEAETALAKAAAFRV